MASVNKVIIIGHVGKDPEMRYSGAGDAICNLTVATTDTWKDKQTGEKKEQTEWHRVSMFGKLAEIACQYLKKGSLAYVEGSLRTREYTGKDGIKRYVTEIRADSMKMLGGKGDSAQSQPAQQRPAQHAQGGKPDFDLDDDIPFN